jgi:hypothetical protein
MTIAHVGVSHQTAPVEVLEKLADAELARLHDPLPGLSGGNGPDQRGAGSHGGPEGPIAHRNGRMVRRAWDRATL